MNKSANSTCPQIVLDWIAWYPEGELPSNLRSAIELHAAECAACRREIADLTGEASEDSGAGDGAERVFARTLERIQARPPARALRRRRFWRVQPSLAVAAGLAVATLSGTVGFVATQRLWGDLAPTYTTATERENGQPSRGVYLDVVFRGDAPFAEIARAMQAIGANVEDGPSASGVVHLRLAQGADAALAARRLESGDLRVAEFAQPAP